jgi:hypothetical protein
MMEKSMAQRRRYLSYLLRLWQESGGNPPVWRASLERPHGDDRLNFASLVDLFAFLEHETGLHMPDTQRPDEKGHRSEPGIRDKHGLG